MNNEKKEELIIKFNEIRLDLKKYQENNEDVLEIVDLIDTIIKILIKK